MPDEDETRQAALSAVDELVQSALAYNTPERLRELLDFASRLPSVAPFNAMLLHTQNPNTRFTATATEWAKRGRRVNPGARPMVIMKLMGPVSFVFDVADTEGSPLPPAVQQHIENPFAAEGTVTAADWIKFQKGCARIGIEIIEQPLGPDAAGSIKRLANRAGGIRFQVHINGEHSLPTRFVTLAHELAHLFCGHLGKAPGEFWEDRSQQTLATREMEAEAVASLVGRRRKLVSASAKYLSLYLTPGQPLPSYSLEQILTVAHVVEEVAAGKLPSREKNRRRKANAALQRQQRKTSPGKPDQAKDAADEALAQAFDGLF